MNEFLSVSLVYTISITFETKETLFQWLNENIHEGYYSLLINKTCKIVRAVSNWKSNSSNGYLGHNNSNLGYTRFPSYFPSTFSFISYTFLKQYFNFYYLTILNQQNGLQWNESQCIQVLSTKKFLTFSARKT